MVAHRFSEVIKRVVEELYRDYSESRRSPVTRLREELYRAYYEVKPIIGGHQRSPIIFVDAGFKAFETDVAMLILVNVGARVRDEEGGLHRVSELTDHPPIETYIVYGRVVDREDRPFFKFRVYPVDEAPLLLPEERSLEVSREVEGMINERLAMRSPAKSESRERAVKLFKKLVKYFEGILEIAYALKVGEHLARRSIKVVDGTLVRWFGLRQLSVFRFEGLDIMSMLLGVAKDKVARELLGVYGLVKTTRFTSIARARSVFRAHSPQLMGLYTSVSPESARRASEVLNNALASKLVGVDGVEDAIGVLTRVAHPYSGIWVARFPVTTDNVNVLYLEVHTTGPVLALSSVRVIFDPGIASELGARVDEVVESVMAYRTPLEGSPPHGFMEVDRDVRLGGLQSLKIEGAIVSMIREVTGESGHPLELVFSSARRMRIWA